ncbi:MAG: DNA-binding protein [Chitinophagaceae bacterium]|nr:MAG: DNA-binding protein [Chitinophagaceae bacterium]
MEALLERTTKKDQKIALSTMPFLKETSKRVTKAESNYIKIAIEGKNEFLKIPKKAMFLLFEIMKNMAEGKSITLIPSDSEISTQQAADMLNVSRPHLIKLLEKGQIPYKKVGSHRRIELKDILEYEARQKKNRKTQIDFLAQQAQELNLGY